VPTEKLWSNCAVGGNAMKITFIGAVLIVVIVIAAALFLESTMPQGGPEPPANGSEN